MAGECRFKAPLFNINGGERGIRTLGGTFAPHSLSRRAPSANSAISPQTFFDRINKIYMISMYSLYPDHPTYPPASPFRLSLLGRSAGLAHSPGGQAFPVSRPSYYKPLVKFSNAKFPGGGSRIRTHGPFRNNGFQDRLLRPLGHPSIALFL
jgi:hypothetical protein